MHPNHYLILTARRNLIQYYTYSITNPSVEILKKKLEHCIKFFAILNRIDPGFSELRAFVQRELNFSKLVLIEMDFKAMKITSDDYLTKSRLCFQALDELNKNKMLLEG